MEHMAELGHMWEDCCGRYVHTVYYNYWELVYFNL